MFDKGKMKEPEPKLEDVVLHLASAVAYMSDVMQKLNDEVLTLKEDVGKLIENNC